MSPGEPTRVRYAERMKSTAVGAQVARRSLTWTIVQRKGLETSVLLTLRRGRRTQEVNLPVCITGPCWADVDLRPVAAAPVQRELGLNVRGKLETPDDH